MDKIESRIHSVEHTIYTYQAKLTLLKWINGEDTEFPGSHAWDEKDFAVLPYSPIYVDRGRDGDLFLSYVERPKGEGVIRLGLQTRYFDVYATGYSDMEKADWGPGLVMADVEGWGSLDGLRIKLLDPPEELQKEYGMSLMFEARDAVRLFMDKRGQTRDGWFRWRAEDVEAVEQLKWWEKKHG